MSNNKESEEDYGIIVLDNNSFGDPFGFDSKSDDMFEGGKPDEVDDNSSLDKDDDKPEDAKDSFGFPVEDQTSGREKQTPGTIVSSETSEVLREQLKKLYGNDITVVQDKDGEEVEVSIDEIDVTPETFTDIALQVKARETEELLKDTVSLAGTDDMLKKIVEIGKAGGDITAVIHNKARFIDPLDSLDMDTEEGHKGAIALLISGTGGTQDDIDAKLLLYKERGTMEEEGKKAEKAIRDQMAAFMEKQAKTAIEKEESDREFMKVYKKGLKEHLSTNFQLKDPYIGELVNYATKVGADGRTDFTRNLTEALKDPEKAHKIALLLYDEKEYNSQVSNKKITDAKIGSAVKLGTVKSNNTKSDPIRHTNRRNDDVDFVPVG